MAAFMTLILATAAILLCYAALRHYSSPLRSFPGPWAAQFTNLWRLIDVYRGNEDKTQRDLHRRHGAAVRIGPNCLSLTDHSLIKTIYATRNPLRKSEFYAAGDTVAQGKVVQGQFATRDEQWHEYLVKPVRRAYSLDSVLQFEGLVDQTLDCLVQKLDGFTSKSGRGIECDLGQLLHHFAWDIIGQITFSERLGALDNDPQILELLQDGRRAIEYLAIIGQMPILDRIFKNPVFPIGPLGFKIAADWAAAKLAARVNGIDKRPDKRQRDFADIFIDAEQGADGEGAQMTQRQIGWLITNSVAGSDTVAATLQAAVYHLGRNPDVQDRLVAELDGAMNDAGRRDLTWKECQQLPFLDAVVKETLRIAPAIGHLLERVVAAGGLLLPDGRHVPAGTVVGLNPRVVNHDQDIYGADADSFVPDRWLRADGESEREYSRRVARMKDADFTFGFGSRGCIGRNIVFLEVYKTIARLYGTFEIRFADPKKEWTVINRWIVKQTGISVYLRRRDGRESGDTAVSC